MFAEIMYCTVVYLWAIKEMTELNNKLKNIGLGGTGNNTGAENLVNL